MRLSLGLLGFRSRQLLSGSGNPRCAVDSAPSAQLPLGKAGPVSSAPSVVRSYYNCPATASVGRAWLLASAEPTSIFSVRSHCSYSQISGSARPSLHSKCLLSATRRTQLRVSAGPLRLASSRALTHERERSRLRLVAASLTADLAFSIPPLHPQPLCSSPLQVSSACFGSAPSRLTSSLTLGTWLVGSPLQLRTSRQSSSAISGFCVRQGSSVDLAPLGQPAPRPPGPCHISVTFARADPCAHPRSSIASNRAASTAFSNFAFSAES